MARGVDDLAPGPDDGPDEDCDDGNTVTETCGYVAPYPSIDPPGPDDHWCPVCDATCLDAEGAHWCGDTITDADDGETCDDGNHVDGDGCDATCRIENDACQAATCDAADSIVVRPGDGIVALPNAVFTPTAPPSAALTYPCAGRSDLASVSNQLVGDDWWLIVPEGRMSVRDLLGSTRVDRTLPMSAPLSDVSGVREALDGSWHLVWVHTWVGEQGGALRFDAVRVDGQRAPLVDGSSSGDSDRAALQRLLASCDAPEMREVRAACVRDVEDRIERERQRSGE